ncbi:MAG: argininosuccinate lyase [Gemmataceae bacterium]
MSQKQWGGRFDGSTDARVEAFTESISFDRRLYRHDLQASKAHAAMLAEVGLISKDESLQIATALDEIGEEITAGKMAFSISLEDIHTHIEKALIARLGDTGRKLHTGRSRNDQIATDVKLWVRDAIDELDEQLQELQRSFVGFADREAGVIIPGYTHLQRAQPVLAAHAFLAYVEKFARDRDRLKDTRRRLNVLPLGAAALAGSSLPIDREAVRRRLDFDSVARNSLDVSSDRDFLVDFVYSLSMIATHLSGWAEEWILWSTTEFDFLRIPDAFCTGSSIMPHKKNPDSLELTRGKSARVVACLQQLFMLLKGLPLAYNRDLQEDKTAVFDAFDIINGMLAVAAPLVAGSALKRESIAQWIEDGFLDATTLMEAFIKAGVPMRTAHEAVGTLVRSCEKKHCRLADLPAAEFEAFCPGIGPKLKDVLGVANAVKAFRSYGSTSPAEVDKQLAFWKQELGVTK